MKQQPKTINFYNNVLTKGCLHGMSVGEDLTLCMEDNTKYSAYFAKMFDTQDDDMTYHRLMLDAQFSNAKLVLLVVATNETEIYVDDEAVILSEYIADKNIPPLKKVENLQALNGERFVNQTDVLLHDLKGKDLYVYIGVHPMEDADVKIKGFSVELPKCSFVEYFPEIYQSSDGFFERYVGVFQSMFLDLEKRVDEVPSMLDYENTQLENISSLAQWVGLDTCNGIFSNEQLKYMIRNLDVFQGSKGTKATLEEVIFLATGLKPKIVEYFEWSNRVSRNPEIESLYKTLYGQNHTYFTVILDPPTKDLPISTKDLTKLVESFTPIGTQLHLVILSNNNHVDTHCYLDVNSYLSLPSIANIDGFTLGEYVVLAEE